MTKLIILTVFLALVGISALCSLEATGIVDDVDHKGVGLIGFEGRKHDLVKRAVDGDVNDGADEADLLNDSKTTKKPKKKPKKKPITAGPSTTASPGSKGSTSTTTTTTGKPKSSRNPVTHEPYASGSTTLTPSKSVIGRATTAKPTTKPNPDSTTTMKPMPATATTSVPDDPDEESIDELRKNKATEKALLAKVQEAVREWVSFMESHGKRTLNPHKARTLFIDLDAIRGRYFSRRRKMNRMYMNRRPRVSYQPTDDATPVKSSRVVWPVKDDENQE